MALPFRVRDIFGCLLCWAIAAACVTMAVRVPGDWGEAGGGIVGAVVFGGLAVGETLTLWSKWRRRNHAYP